MRSSLKRCLSKPDFLLDFYGIFMASSPEAREKFKDTDLKRQTEVLAETLWVMALAAESAPDSPTWRDLPRLAEKHDRAHLDIRPGLYDLWLDSLIDAVRRHDPVFSAEIEKVWRETLAAGIEYMRSRH
jgi:hemoglobin-like flavoprotein